jgi:ATP-dependent RNA helicase DDX42
MVCTPGRLIDLIKMKGCTLRRTTYIVFDEADRMFDMGFEPQVLITSLHPEQTSLTTASFRYGGGASDFPQRYVAN